MAHNKLSDKLDRITDRDLGMEFNDAAVWGRLEQRLDNRKSFVFWWVAAACFLVGLTLLPIRLQNDSLKSEPAITKSIEPSIPQSLTVPEEKMPLEANQQPHLAKEINNLKRIQTNEMIVAEVKGVSLALQPIELPQSTKMKSSLFATEDISIIQASLERPSIQKGRTMSIRAQWQKSPTKSSVKNQALKIKLNEASKQ